jgi:hypothetical protein
VIEIAHDPFKLALTHLPMGKLYPRVRYHLGNTQRGLFDG